MDEERTNLQQLCRFWSISKWTKISDESVSCCSEGKKRGSKLVFAKCA